MFFQHKQYYSFALVFWQIILNIPSSLFFLFIIDIFCLSGEELLISVPAMPLILVSLLQALWSS